MIIHEYLLHGLVGAAQSYSRRALFSLLVRRLSHSFSGPSANVCSGRPVVEQPCSRERSTALRQS